MRSSLGFSFPLLAVLLLVGCSSSPSSSPSADASDVDAAPIVPGCDGVVVAMDATGAVLATDGTSVFVLTVAATGDRVVSQVVGGALQQVADVPGDAPTPAVLYDQPPQLFADSDRFYVNTSHDVVGSIAAADRHDGGVTTLTSELGGALVPSPTFASDGAYLYFETYGADDGNAFARVPVTGGPTEAVTQDGYPPYGTFAVDGAHLYVLGPFVPGLQAENALTLTTYATPPADGGDAFNDGVEYELGVCTHPGTLQPVEGGVVAGCTVDGGAPAGLYALTVPTPAGPSPTNGTLVADGDGLDARTFVVAGGNVYFDTGGLAPMDAGASGQPYVYRVPLSAAGGTKPAPLIRTGSVSSMVAVGAELYVAGTCGIQQTQM